MEISHVKSFEAFITAISDKPVLTRWLFRGQANADWGLVPTIGRSNYQVDHEVGFFQLFQRRAYEFLDDSHALSEWDWLAIAQHHGLHTRLLDWTKNPLAATFFAVEATLETDAALFAYLPDEPALQYDADSGPFNLAPGVTWVIPRRVAARITRQSGVFTCHTPPTNDFSHLDSDDLQLHKMIIPRSLCHEFRVNLANLGIDRSTLFPDLDGMAAHINWMRNF